MVGYQTQESLEGALNNFRRSEPSPPPGSHPHALPTCAYTTLNTPDKALSLLGWTISAPNHSHFSDSFS